MREDLNKNQWYLLVSRGEDCAQSGSHAIPCGLVAQKVLSKHSEAYKPCTYAHIRMNVLNSAVTNKEDTFVHNPRGVGLPIVGKNGFLAVFLEPLDPILCVGLAAKIVLFMFTGKKCPKKSSRKIPGRILQSIEQKSPTYFRIVVRPFVWQGKTQKAMHNSAQECARTRPPQPGRAVYTLFVHDSQLLVCTQKERRKKGKSKRQGCEIKGNSKLRVSFSPVFFGDKPICHSTSHRTFPVFASFSPILRLAEARTFSPAGKWLRSAKVG